jgi:hypothetical protein
MPHIHACDHAGHEQHEYCQFDQILVSSVPTSLKSLRSGFAYAKPDDGPAFRFAGRTHAVCDDQSLTHQMAQRGDAAAGVQQKRNRAVVRRGGEQFEGCMLVGREHLNRRHHPGRNPSAAEDAKDEDRRSHHDPRGSDPQQFGPPQASSTGSLCTEATIAAPVPIASISNAKITTVIFIAPPGSKMAAASLQLAPRRHLPAPALERSATPRSRLKPPARTRCTTRLSWDAPYYSQLVKDRRFETFWGLLNAADLGFAQSVARGQPRVSGHLTIATRPVRQVTRRRPLAIGFVPP